MTLEDLTIGKKIYFGSKERTIKGVEKIIHGEYYRNKNILAEVALIGKRGGKAKACLYASGRLIIVTTGDYGYFEGYRVRDGNIGSVRKKKTVVVTEKVVIKTPEEEIIEGRKEYVLALQNGIHKSMGISIGIIDCVDHLSFFTYHHYSFASLMRKMMRHFDLEVAVTEGGKKFMINIGMDSLRKNGHLLVG